MFCFISQLLFVSLTYKRFTCLFNIMTDMLRQTGDHPRMEALVGNPISLSYYIASNMPIQDHTRQELLEIDSTLARLKREIQLLEGMDTLRCNYCHVRSFFLVNMLKPIIPVFWVLLAFICCTQLYGTIHT